MKELLNVCLGATLLAGALALLLSPSPSAQGMVLGTVTDPSGAVVPGATVTLLGPTAHRTKITDGAGQFALAGLSPGTYEVEVTASGFAKFEDDDLVVSAGQETEANAPLAISQPRQAVTILAASGRQQ